MRYYTKLAGILLLAAPLLLTAGFFVPNHLIKLLFLVAGLAGGVMGTLGRLRPLIWLGETELLYRADPLDRWQRLPLAAVSELVQQSGTPYEAGGLQVTAAGQIHEVPVGKLRGRAQAELLAALAERTQCAVSVAATDA
jgi:hypothetical protein